MPKKILLIGLFAVVVAGCAEQQIYQRRMEFIEEEYAPYDNTGTGKIIGQAFMKTAGGDVKYGAGNTVSLNPVTSYSKEWFNLTVSHGMTNISGADPRVYKYYRKTIADGEGRFEFENLPAGEYYIVCDIYWRYYAGGYSATTTTGARVGIKATVKDGETTKAIVTRN